MSAAAEVGPGPLISVITVAYQSAATIGDTLTSAAGQRGVRLEHLVIDGASRDDTLARVREHGSHVARVLSEPDRGIYDAMNKGLGLATGDLVGFLNADDVLADEQALARVARAAAAGADVVYGDLVYVQADDLARVQRHWRSGSFSMRGLRTGWMPPHPTLYVRRTLMQELGGFDANLRIAADYDFILRCLSRPGLQVAYVPQVQVRMRAGGVSNRSLTSMKRKSSEDLLALRRSGVGGIGTLLCKNLRKVPQFFV
jgi:glycosyltransferase